MMHRKNLWAIAIVAVILCIVILLSACKGAEARVYTQSVKITTEQVDEKGSLVIIESYRDSELMNSMHFIDGDGDGIIDGKSGPKERGYWPKGWGWFDDLYDDVIVGQSNIWSKDGKIKIQNGNTHEFRIGEYQCEQIRSTD
jgi:hypothetical protein